MRKILLYSTVVAFLMTSGLLYAQKTKKPVTKPHPIVIKTGIGTAKPPDTGKKETKPAEKKGETAKKAGISSAGVPEDVVSAWINHQDTLRHLVTKDPDSNCQD